MRSSAVPGVGGVHGTLSNQVVGTTNKNGNLLIPNMLPYYGNRVGIEDKDIPFEYNINATEMTIAPPYRGRRGGAIPRQESPECFGDCDGRRAGEPRGAGLRTNHGCR